MAFRESGTARLRRAEARAGSNGASRSGIVQGCLATKERGSSVPAEILDGKPWPRGFAARWPLRSPS